MHPARGLPTAPCFYLCRFIILRAAALYKNRSFLCPANGEQHARLQFLRVVHHGLVLDIPFNGRTADFIFRMMRHPPTQGIICILDILIWYASQPRTCPPGSPTHSVRPRLQPPVLQHPYAHKKTPLRGTAPVWGRYAAHLPASFARAVPRTGRASLQSEWCAGACIKIT